MSKVYFAYGSNMKIERMVKRVPSAMPVGYAKLMDKKLAFNKISTDGTGKTNIVDSQDNIVLGVLFEVDESEVVNLDSVEIGYERQDITVLGSDDKPISVFTYISTKTNDALKPHDTYLSYLVQGAEENGLPQDYIDNIKKIESVPDPKSRNNIVKPVLLSSNEQRCIVAYLDSVQARLASLRELQSATGEELSALLPSVLDKAFKGEL